MIETREGLEELSTSLEHTKDVLNARLARINEVLTVKNLSTQTTLRGAIDEVKKLPTLENDNSVTNIYNHITENAQRHKLTYNDGVCLDASSGHWDEWQQTYFCMGADMQSAPNGSKDWFYVDCFLFDGWWTIQRAVFLPDPTKIYMRHRGGASWTQWEQVN